MDFKGLVFQIACMTDTIGLFSLCKTTSLLLPPTWPVLSGPAQYVWVLFVHFFFFRYCYSLFEGIKGSALMTLSCFLLAHKVLGKDKGKG